MLQNARVRLLHVSAFQKIVSSVRSLKWFDICLLKNPFFVYFVCHPNIRKLLSVRQHPLPIIFYWHVFCAHFLYGFCAVHLLYGIYPRNSYISPQNGDFHTNCGRSMCNSADY